METFYLEREDGSLKPFFNIPFEEWDELYKLYKGLQTPDQPPRFLLRDLRITGEIQGDFAFFTVTAKAVTQSDGWIRIPLSLHQAVIVPGDDFTSGSNLLEFDRNGDGFVWRVMGKTGQRQTLTVRIATKLRRLGDQRVVELTIPNATTSRFQLVVHESDIVVDAGENAFLLNTQSLENDKTRITLDGVGGPLRVLWQKKESRANVMSVIKSVGAVRVNIENQNGEFGIRADAALQISFPTGGIDSFVVRCPPDMKYLPQNQPGLRATLLPPSDPRLADARKDCEHVEFRLYQASTGPIDVRLIVAQNLAASDRTRFFEIGGFDVLGAVSQTGTISLAANADWSFDWTYNSAVEQLEEISDALRRQGVVARFGFNSQPCSLRIKVLQKENRVHVEPHYRLTIEPDRALLDATLSYRLRGATTKEIALDFTDWQVDALAIGENNLLQSPLLDTSQPLRLSLANLDQAPMRDFELAVSAVFYFPTSGPVVVPLPAPIATSNAPAQVTILHSEQIDVFPLMEKIRGLTEVTRPASAVPAGADESTEYRGWGRPERLVYAANIQLRPPQILASSEGKVTLAANQVQVRQNIAYRVLYRSVPRLLVKLPKQLASDSSLEILLDNHVAKLTEIPQESASEESIVSIALPTPHTGMFNVSVQFHQSISDDPASEQSLLQVPLAVPVFEGEGRVSETTITVDGYDGREIETDESWTVVAHTMTTAGSTIQMRASGSQPAEVLRLKLSGVSVLSLRDSIVDIAWLQTWLSGSRRNDRLAMRLTTTLDKVRFRLPTSAELEDVAVDRRQVTSQVTQVAGDVIIRLPPSNGRTRVIEVWYSLSNPFDGPGQFVLDLPQLIDADWTRRFYWQLVLPRNEHFLLGAGEFTPESNWNWRTPPFGRRPRFTQRDLEQMVGTSEQLPLPETTNQYLFSSQSAVGRVQIATASRGQILLVTALVSFIIGLLFIYFAPLRHPAALLGLCVVLISIGLLFPQPAIQIAQLASLGILFVLVSFALRRFLTRTRTGPAIVHGSSLNAVEPGATESRFGLVDGSSQTSTKALVVSHASESSSS